MCLSDVYQLTPDDVTQIRRQNTFFRDIIKRVAEWGEVITGLPGRLELLELAVRESSEEEANAVKGLAGRIKRLEELELLRQTGQDDSPKALKLKADIQDEHSVEYLQELLVTVTKNLQILELRRARFGDAVHFSVINEIEEQQAARERIQLELDALKIKHQAEQIGR